MKKLKGIKTWLPIFSGFYNTIWEFDYHYVIDYINESKKQGKIEYDNLEIDNEQYEEDISKAFCSQIENVLHDYIEKVEFEKLQYPKQYNYINNSIDCIITPKIENIKKFIYENKDVFCKYLKNKYTSYDGFISGYNNDFLSWENDTNNFTTFENSHVLGSILQFIAEVLNIQELDIYDNITDFISYLEYIENYDQCLNAPVCNKCNKFIENINILNDISKYKGIVKKYPSYILCDECLENN